MVSSSVDSVGTMPRFCTVHATPERRAAAARRVAQSLSEHVVMIAGLRSARARVRPAAGRTLIWNRDGRRPRLSTEPLHVLLVEDEPGHVELARRAFDGRPGEFEVSVAETIGAARAPARGATTRRTS